MEFCRAKRKFRPVKDFPKVGKNAFKGTSKKLKVILPKSLSKAKKKKYKKLFKGKGNKKLRVK